MTELSNSDFQRLADMIYRHSGIRYDDKKKYLFENRLSHRLHELEITDFREYLNRLNSRSTQEVEVEYMVNAITTNETCFFRNTRQLDALKNHILPKIVEKLQENRRWDFRVWSSAASTGEEIYTLGMFLKQNNLIPSDIGIYLYASDINRDVLETARKGVYKKHSLRKTPDEYINKFFRKDGDEYHIKHDKIPAVRFEQRNLVNLKPAAVLRDFDLVFCANVLIYFDNEAKKKVAQGIHHSMSPWGHLFLGHAESLHGVTKDFKLVNAGGIPAYEKA